MGAYHDIGGNTAQKSTLGNCDNPLVVNFALYLSARFGPLRLMSRTRLVSEAFTSPVASAFKGLQLVEKVTFKKFSASYHLSVSRDVCGSLSSPSLWVSRTYYLVRKDPEVHILPPVKQVYIDVGSLTWISRFFRPSAVTAEDGSTFRLFILLRQARGTESCARNTLGRPKNRCGWGELVRCGCPRITQCDSLHSASAIYLSWPRVSRQSDVVNCPFAAVGLTIVKPTSTVRIFECLLWLVCCCS